MHNKRETGRVSRETGRVSRETGRVSRETRDSENNTEYAPCRRRGHYSRETAKRTLSEEDISCFIRNKKRHVSNKTLQAKFKTRPVSNHKCLACTKTRYARDETGLQKAELRFARNKTTVLKRRRVWHNSKHASRETSRVVLPRPKLDCQPLFWK